MLPIVLLSGNKNSGKDTVGQVLAEHFNGVTLALADPMKRFAKEVFVFTTNQLWGPSTNREVPDTMYSEREAWRKAYARLEQKAPDWIKDIGIPVMKQGDAFKALRVWFKDLWENHPIGEGVIPRHVLQTLGTEWGREVSSTLWGDHGLATANTILDNPGVSYSAHLGYGVEATHDMVIVTDGRFRNEINQFRRAGGLVIKINRPLNVNSDAHASEREMDTIPNYMYDVILTNNGSLDDLKSAAIIAIESCLTPTYIESNHLNWVGKL